jgi:ferredoxin
MIMKITVEKDKCIASGQCVLIAPENFDQDDDGIVVVLEEHPLPNQVPAVLEAVRVCPVRLISYSE